MMGDDDKKHIDAIAALCKLAETNFPSNTDIRLSVDGNASGSVRVPWYALQKLIDKKARK